MAGQVENAWKVETHIVSPDGSAKLLSWKVWYSSLQSRLLWDLGRILDSCGKSERNEKTKLKNVLKTDLPKWQRWWMSAGLLWQKQACSTYRKETSRRSRRSRGGALAEHPCSPCYAGLLEQGAQNYPGQIFVEQCVVAY